MVTIRLSASRVSFLPVMLAPSPMEASTLLLLTIVAKEAPIPTFAPFETLTAPARIAILLLSVASMSILLASIFVLSSTVALVSALLTRTETAPEMQALPPLPATEPAIACAAISPANRPLVFCARSAAIVTSPLTVLSVSSLLSASYPRIWPDALVLAWFLLTLTATPMATELVFCARDTARPVPSVRKLPSLAERIFAPPAVRIVPSKVVVAICLLMVTPTAAAT